MTRDPETIRKDHELKHTEYPPDPSSFFEDHGPGMIFDHGPRTVDELNADVVRLAIEYGWTPPAAPDGSQRDALELHDDGHEWIEPDVLSVGEALAWDADDATDYLNDLLPNGWFVANDGYAGAFGIWSTDRPGGGEASE